MPSGMRSYVLKALSGNPSVAARLLQGITEDNPIWDCRPDADRFTLREIVAHLADWNPIFLERIQRTLNEDHPTLPDVDEEAVAIQNDYAHSDPIAGIHRFQESRKVMMDVLLNLSDDDWGRTALKKPLGDLSVELQCVLVLAHDGYHLHQIVQWFKSGGN